MAKANKKVLDVFDGIKYVDKALNEAAGVKENVKEESFESKLKKRLLENTDEAGEKELTEYSTNQSYDYGYNYDGKNQYLGEDEPGMENEFDNDDDSDVDVEMDLDGLGLDLEVDPNAMKAAHGDMAGEFSDEDEDDFSTRDEDYDFTEDKELMEALLGEEDPNMLTPDATTDVNVDVPAPTDIAATGAEAGAAPAVGDMGAEGLPTDGVSDAGMEPDMGAEPGAEPGMADLGGAGAPSMGGPAMGAPAGTADMGADMATSPVGAPEDIDQLINNLVSPEADMEESAPVVIGENSELKDLGFSDLKDEDLTSKVKMEAKKSVKKEGEIKLTKLGDKDITGNVKGATAGGEAVKHSGTGKRNDPKGEEYVDLGDEDITSGKVKETAAGAAKAPSQPKFAAVKEESARKSKALYNLAEKVVDLQDELTKLKFENFKLEKVNTVLTLLPELKQATREKLVEKFDACKSYAEAKKLYTEVSSMVKDFKRGSINEAVLKNSKSTKYLAEGVDGSENGAADDNNEQARKNYLMGMKGFDDQYYGSGI